MNKQKKILVIGGAGYIGSALISQIKLRNWDYINLDRKYKNPKMFDILLDYRYLEFFPEPLENVTHVVLLAGQSSVGSCLDTQLTLDNNVVGFTKLLDLLPPNIPLIYASSASVYPKSDIPQDETCDKFEFSNMYDLSKFTIDQIAKLSDKPTYGLRFGTVCGWSENTRFDLVFNRMIKDAIEQKKITVFNPKSRRSLLPIQHAAEAILKIIETDDNSKAGVYNLASYNYTILEIAQQVSKIIPCDIDITFGDGPNYSFILNCSKFEKEFDFKLRGNIRDDIHNFREMFNEEAYYKSLGV